MARPLKVQAGEHPVEAAIAAGKIPPSRRDHYMRQFKKLPKATRKLLDELEAALPPDDQDGFDVQSTEEYERPSEYPREWLGPQAAAASQAPQAQAPPLPQPGGNITAEPEAAPAIAAKVQPG